MQCKLIKTEAFSFGDKKKSEKCSTWFKLNLVKINYTVAILLSYFPFLFLCSAGKAGAHTVMRGQLAVEVAQRPLWMILRNVTLAHWALGRLMSRSQALRIMWSLNEIHHCITWMSTVTEKENILAIKRLSLNPEKKRRRTGHAQNCP